MTQSNRPVSSTFISLVIECQTDAGKSNEQIAKELGVAPNVYRLCLDGLSKLPYRLIKPLAKAIDYPYADLLHVMLQEQSPDLLAAIEAAWGTTALTVNERNLITSYRHLAKGQDVVPIVLDGNSIIALVAA
jgi:hypothetical protein